MGVGFVEYKVSIIVPIYNAEEYLEECLDSIINQTYQNIEIILINDGSKDNSGEICERYQNQDTRIITFHNDNHGVSYSRNCGIKISSGQYILFVDCDDTIDETYVEKLMKPIKQQNYDLVLCEINIKTKNIPLFVRKKEKSGIFSEDFIYYLDLLKYPFVKLYKSEIIKKNGLIFNVNMSAGEDQLFNLQYFYFVETYKYIHQKLYNYIDRNPHSLSKIKNETVLNGMMNVFKERKALLLYNHIWKKEEITSWYIIPTFWWNLHTGGRIDSYTEVKNRIKVLEPFFIQPYRAINTKQFFVLKCLQQQWYIPLYFYYLLKNRKHIIKR